MALDLAAARRAVAYPHLVESLKIALVVGTALNLINQGDAVLPAGPPLNWGKLALTYCVPFVVATYSAYRAFRAQNLSSHPR